MKKSHAKIFIQKIIDCIDYHQSYPSNRSECTTKNKRHFELLIFLISGVVDIFNKLSSSLLDAKCFADIRVTKLKTKFTAVQLSNITKKTENRKNDVKTQELQ